VATALLADSRVPTRRRDIQDRLVCAYERLHAECGATTTEFCAAIAIPERTFRSWRARPPKSTEPAPEPEPTPRRRDKNTGRFALEVTAPGIQLGSDTTDVKVLGIDLKLTASQDIGAREQRLWEAFQLDQRETNELVSSVVAQAARGRDGMQHITDQGTPFLAAAARAAYDDLGLEHAPQKEGAPTEKATVERAFHTAKSALAPLLDLTNRMAEALPALRQTELAKHVGTLLFAVFLKVYAAGRRHLAHPLEGHDPDALHAIIEEQRQNARAEDRSVRLFLEGIHAEYAMPGSRETFVKAFRRYPLEDLHVAERRFRRYACRCVTRVCDRYFAAVIRDVHERARKRRAAERARRCAASEVRHAKADADRRADDLNEHPERRLCEGLNLLAETWQSELGRFAADGLIAKASLRCATLAFVQRDPGSAADELERHFRAWLAARPEIPLSLQHAVRAVLSQVFTDIRGAANTPHSPDFIRVILPSSARSFLENQRPSRLPHLRI
jgi:hypothetical protein